MVQITNDPKIVRMALDMATNIPKNPVSQKMYEKLVVNYAKNLENMRKSLPVNAIERFVGDEMRQRAVGKFTSIRNFGLPKL